MIKTKAYATHGPTELLKPFELQRREPKPYDVLIDIKYCGICHSDIHQARNEWGASHYPMVPGHEITGIVVRIGDKVSKFKIGDQVGVGCMIDSCRECKPCRQGFQQHCITGPNFTYNNVEKDGKTPTQGGYSTQIVVDENYVLHIPDQLPLDGSAPLLCAGITTYSPLKRWGIGPGKKVAIIGLGGLGHMAIKFAHAMGAEVTVLSQILKKKEEAKRLGSDHFYATNDSSTFEKLASTFDFMLNTVSARFDLNQYLQLLDLSGTMVLVGVPPEPLDIHASGIITNQRNLAGSLIGGIAETQEMLNFCGQHNIVSDIELVPIQKVNEAYDRVMKSDVRYRFVIDCQTIA